MKNRFSKWVIVRAMALLVPGLVLSCTNELDEMYESPSLEISVENTSPYHIPLNAALENLEKTMDVMGITTTRAQYNRARWKIERIPMSQFKPETRATADGVSDAIYVVNFGNNEGYAIVSADTRLPNDVIAVTNSGMVNFNPNPWDNPLDTLTLEDLYVAEDDDYLLGTVENDGLIEDLVTNYIIGWTDSLRNNEDEFGNPLTPPGDIITPGEGDDSGMSVSYTTVVDSCAAKLRTTWHQNTPFNLYCDKRFYHYNIWGNETFSVKEYDFDFIEKWGDDYIRTEDLPAGCVAIAVAQIIVCNKYPALSDLINCEEGFGWNSLSLEATTDSDQCHYQASLVHNIGVGCNMKYGFLRQKQSFTTPAAAKRYLEDIGYDDVDCKWYDFGTVKSMLKNNYPVFIGAVRLTGGVGGHAWVIDGYKTKSTIKTTRRNGTILNETVVNSTDYVHCNWGWQNGSNNGWFANELLEEKNINVYDAEEFDSTNNDYRYHYDFWFRMIEYVKP